MSKGMDKILGSIAPKSSLGCGACTTCTVYRPLAFSRECCGDDVVLLRLSTEEDFWSFWVEWPQSWRREDFTVIPQRFSQLEWFGLLLPLSGILVQEQVNEVAVNVDS